MVHCRFAGRMWAAGRRRTRNVQVRVPCRVQLSMLRAAQSCDVLRANADVLMVGG